MWFQSKQWKRLKVGHWLDIKRKNKIEDTKEKEKRQIDRNKNTHLSPHNRHLSLKHGFVKAFICLKRKKKKTSPVSRCPVSHVTLLPDTSLFIHSNLSKQRKTGEKRKVFRWVVPWTSHRGPHRGPGQSSCQRGGTAPGPGSPVRRPP